MNRVFTYGFALVLWVIFSVAGHAQELWTEYGMNYRMQDNLSMGLEFHNRFHDVSGFSNYKNATELSLEYRLSKHFKVGGAYRYTTLRGMEDSPDTDLLDDRQRYSVDLHGKLPLNSKLKLKNRSRYQLSTEDFGDARKFYRNKTTLEIRLDKRTDFYFAEEFFFRLDKDKPLASRVSCGFDYELTPKFTVSPFYKVERKIQHFDVKRNYIVGVGVFLKL